MTEPSKPCLMVVTERPDLFSEVLPTSMSPRFEVVFAGKRDNILPTVEEKRIRVLVLEVGESEEWEAKLMKAVKMFDPLLDVIVTGPPQPSEKVMDWINLGATDYLLRPLHGDSLELILTRLEEKRQLRRETYELEKKLEEKYIFQEMVGKSPFMLDVFSLIEKIAKHFSTVLVTGDTGTGKELAARAIQSLSPVKNRRLVVCDCASLPDSLFESELFGYVKGAFTGAERDRKGLFEEAHEGVILLDEVGEVPLTVQAKLLRVLEAHRFRPLGQSAEKKSDVRVIACTNQSLEKRVREGKFREDLFHRLNKVEIHLPPLREKREDTLLLVRYFLGHFNRKFSKRIRGISRDTQKFFLSYSWPGNVRELRNVVESACILCQRDFIDLGDLPKYLQEKHRTGSASQLFEQSRTRSLQSLETEYIAYLIQKNKGNIRQTARILDISRTTLYDKLRKYNIEVSRN